jgi:transcriptional regulator with XRE-family HTH domain
MAQKEDPRTIVGRTVRARRKKLGLSQEGLAERAGLHWTYVGGVERGERNVSLINLCRIATGLELRVSDLLKAIPRGWMDHRT